MDWPGDVSDRKSHGEFFAYLAGNLISWQFRKQSTVARSATKAEYKSLVDVASELIWLKKVLVELGITSSPQARVFWY